jgi:hypothetical protein
VTINGKSVVVPDDWTVEEIIENLGIEVKGEYIYVTHKDETKDVYKLVDGKWSAASVQSASLVSLQSGEEGGEEEPPAEETKNGYVPQEGDKIEFNFVSVTYTDGDAADVAEEQAKEYETELTKDDLVKYGTSVPVGKNGTGKGTGALVTVGDGDAEYYKYGDKVTANGNVEIETGYVAITATVTSSAVAGQRYTVDHVEPAYTAYAAAEVAVADSDPACTVYLSVSGKSTLSDKLEVAYTIGSDGEATTLPEADEDGLIAIEISTIDASKDVSIKINLSTQTKTEEPSDE